MGNKTTSIGMSKLLANASKMEKEIKETENVAPTITVEAEQTKQNGEEQPQEVKEVIKPEENVLSEKKNKRIRKRTSLAIERKSTVYYSRKGK